jgi:hypothetical protein
VRFDPLPEGHYRFTIRRGEASPDRLTPATPLQWRTRTVPFTPYTEARFDSPHLRLIGARGGRAFGRNQRARRARIALMPTTPPAAALHSASGPTTAEAIALLDAEFPWLRRA